jgi:hypothetical protein
MPLAIYWLTGLALMVPASTVLLVALCRRKAPPE